MGYGRAYALNTDQCNVVIEGTPIINSISTSVLYNPEPTH